MKNYRILLIFMLLVGALLLVPSIGYPSKEGEEIPHPLILSLSWSPDGQKIAFSASLHYDGEPADIYVVDINSKQVINLTNTPNIHEDHPSFSPDGSLIAYERDDGSAPSPCIWLMNADGSEQRQLTHRKSYNPVWSPDGNYLVVGGFFSGDFGDGYDLLLITKEGEEVKLLLAAPEDEFPVAWLGNHIYFQKPDSLPGGGLSYWVLWCYDLSTGQRIRISEPGEYHSPSFSPDDSKIAYSMEDKLWLCNIDGSGKLLLYNEKPYSCAGEPSWSPTGQKIAFIKVDCTQVEDPESQEMYWMGYRENIYLINPNGTGLEQITFFNGFLAKGKKPTVFAKGKGSTISKTVQAKRSVEPKTSGERTKIAKNIPLPPQGSPIREDTPKSSQVPLLAGGLSLSALSYAVWKFLKLLS